MELRRAADVLPSHKVPDAHAKARWRRRSITLDADTTLAAYEAGLTDSAAPALVLVHGLGHWALGAWDSLGAELEATHRLIAFDLPGFGDSSKPDRTYGTRFFVAALERIVEEFGPQRYGLVGHSLGGLISADFASRNPPGLQSLTLIAPAGFTRSLKLFARIVGSHPLTALFPAFIPSRAFVRRVFEMSVYDPAALDREMYEEAYRLSQDAAMTRAFARVYRDAWQTCANMPAEHARYARWTGPTLIVWGHEDRYVPIAALPTARRVYPHAEVAVLECCGHCPAIEHPREVARLLAQITAR